MFPAARLAGATVSVVLASLVLGAATLPSAPPNIVLILADDLGWADLGCQGADLHETPRIDAFARDGLRFTQAYAMSVCSPTRAMLLTGRHAARVGITIWSEGSLERNTRRPLLQAESRHDLPPAETTLATHLRGGGYFTALVGKWHLGDANHAPETHGFNLNIGGTHWGAPATYWWPYSGAGRFGAQFRYVPHLGFGRPGEYLTDRLTDEALRVIDHAGERPFFLYLAHHAPHAPIEAKEEDVRYFQGKLRPGMRHRNATYAAMVRSLDQGVGRVLDHLNARGLEDRTIVIFTSDNGGQVNIDPPARAGDPVTRNAPLRSGKGSLHEGGIRVPLIVRWPGVTPRGAESAAPVMLGDLFPTLLRAAGRPVPGNIDGLDLAALLRDPAARLGRDALFFHYPHYYDTTTPAGAVRAGDWKLLEYFENGRLELFNLASDPGEARDLAAAEPARATELRSRLAAWRAEVGAKMPSANPAFPARKP
jgi:arylsulfatase A-like enzyme